MQKLVYNFANSGGQVDFKMYTSKKIIDIGNFSTLNFFTWINSVMILFNLISIVLGCKAIYQSYNIYMVRKIKDYLSPFVSTLIHSDILKYRKPRKSMHSRQK